MEAACRGLVAICSAPVSGSRGQVEKLGAEGPEKPRPLLVASLAGGLEKRDCGRGGFSLHAF